MSVTIHVAGLPRPKGSKTAFVVERRDAPPGASGSRKYRAVMTDKPHGHKNKAGKKSSLDLYNEWVTAVRVAAEAVGLETPLDGALAIVVTFFMPRPKSHTRAQREVVWHTTKPDLDKLLRAVLDPLNGVLIADDSRIAVGRPSKRYAIDGRTGATITITRLSDGD